MKISKWFLMMDAIIPDIYTLRDAGSGGEGGCFGGTPRSDESLGRLEGSADSSTQRCNLLQQREAVQGEQREKTHGAKLGDQA